MLGLYRAGVSVVADVPYNALKIPSPPSHIRKKNLPLTFLYGENLCHNALKSFQTDMETANPVQNCAPILYIFLFRCDFCLIQVVSNAVSFVFE